MPEGLTLWDIESEFAEAASSLLDDSLTDQERESAEMIVAEYAMGAANKRESVGRYLIRLDDDEALIDKEILRLRAAKCRIQARRNRVERAVERVMVERGVERLEGHTLALRLCKNGPSAEIADEDAIPAEFKEVETTVKVKKVPLLAALKAGREVPGARLVTDKTRVEVR